MALRTKNFNIMGFSEMSEFKGEFTRDQYIGGLAKKEGIAWNLVVLMITALLNCLPCYHLFQVPSCYSHLLVNLRRKVFTVKLTV